MRKICLLMLIFLLSSHALAQEEGWPLETACIEEVSPIDDWSFSGTILIRGYAGIHGYQQGWETPRVLISEVQMPDALTEFGSFSPDYQWFAYFTGDYTITETYSSFAHVRGLRLINLDAPDEAEFFPHLGTLYGFYESRPVPIWLDNETLFLEGYSDHDSVILNLATGEMEEVEMDFETRQEMYRASFYPESLNAPSPDRTEFAPLGESFMYWLPDGSGYLSSSSEDDLNYSLSIRRGEEEEIIWRLPENQRIQQWLGGFSHDGRYLAVLLENLYISNSGNINISRRDSLSFYIIDMQEERILDPCLMVYDTSLHTSASMYRIPLALQWSPDSQQLAFLSRQFKTENNNAIPLHILDMENYQLYTVAYQLDVGGDDSIIIGWRPE